MASLVFLAGPIAGRRFRLADGEYVIGRRSDCQVFVPDMRVSRQHARLWRNGESWSVEDLGSNNGTFVNGVRLQGALPLHHDDEILIANNKIRVEARGPQSELRMFEPVTIVDTEHHALIRSRNEAAGLPLVSTNLIDIADQRAVRLLERKLDGLQQIVQATAASDTEDALLERISEALLELFPEATDVGVLVEEARTGELHIHCQRHRHGGLDRAPTDGDAASTCAGDACADATSPLRVPGTIIQHVVSDQRGVLLGDAGADTRGKRMGAPLLYQGAHYGVVYVESRSVPFQQEDVDLLAAIATQVGLAMHATRVASELARRERLERDLRVARQIQLSFLPAGVPDAAGLDVAVHYEPAYQIGGDFYDFIWHDPSHLGLVVGDVAGKAISAALYMARVTSELRSRAAIARTPARLLRRVNQELAQLGEDGMFATLVYCVYDLETRALVFTNAGHCVPLLRRGDRVFPLQAERAHAPPLGITPDLSAGEARVQLQPGDLLVLVSDGILEARDGQGAEYGLDRLSRRIQGSQGRAQDVVRAILADLDHHGPHPPGDDMTLLVMAVANGETSERFQLVPDQDGS